jgi:hypothetical protein
MAAEIPRAFRLSSNAIVGLADAQFDVIAAGPNWFKELNF